MTKLLTYAVGDICFHCHCTTVEMMTFPAINTVNFAVQAIAIKLQYSHIADEYFYTGININRSCAVAGTCCWHYCMWIGIV